MKSAYDIIIRPIITEQSMEHADLKKYAFEVAIDANKIEIRKASSRQSKKNRDTAIATKKKKKNLNVSTVWEKNTGNGC